MSRDRGTNEAPDTVNEGPLWPSFAAAQEVRPPGGGNDTARLLLRLRAGVTDTGITTGVHAVW